MAPFGKNQFFGLDYIGKDYFKMFSICELVGWQQDVSYQISR
jgi:hypothetical protein